MDAQFWINAWNTGRTNFHQANYNNKLTQYFPQLDPQRGQKVLVPLCGKSKDLLWLAGSGLKVHGVELHKDAVKAFFSENNLSPVVKTQKAHFTHYNHEQIVLSCGDFFQLNANEKYDLIYDRAALVALPAPMRKTYSEVLNRALKIGGKYLLVVYDYDQTQMEGPPFSVSTSEVHELYEDRFKIELLQSEKPTSEGPRLGAVGGLELKVYRLEKTG
jgi:thiopurine S-methyltransferase